RIPNILVYSESGIFNIELGTWNYRNALLLLKIRQMSYAEFPSRLLEDAVNEFASLPGIGRKTAFRLVMNLLRRNPAEVIRFGESIIKLRSDIHYCTVCNNISDTEMCNICNGPKRDRSLICVVENIQDV